jgi:hypothetical protein
VGRTEKVSTEEVRVGDVIEPINYGLGRRTVEAVEPEGANVLIFTLSGEPWDTTRGPTNTLRLRRYGQVVEREVNA